MRRDIVSILGLIALLLLPAMVSAQAPAAGQAAPAGAQAPAAGARGGRARPALPANQPPGPLNEARHQGFGEIGRKGNIGILFVGDSVTAWWLYSRRGQPSVTGEDVWNGHIAPLEAANFGIAGDITQGVLWRMQNGELEGFKA